MGRGERDWEEFERESIWVCETKISGSGGGGRGGSGYGGGGGGGGDGYGGGGHCEGQQK